MVEKVFISPNRVRAYGNIVNMKTGDDFTLVNSELTVTTDTVDGAEMTVFQFEVEGGISIALVSSSSTCNVGDNVLLTATVLDDNAPVEAAEVTFKVGETVLGTDETDANGVATYTYATSSVGSLSFSASYQTSTSNSVSVTVNHSYSLAFSQATYTASGGSATLECTLLEDNVAKSGASITVTGTDSSTYTATTNNSGVASVTVTGINASTTFTATYQGATATCTVTVQSYLFYDDATVDNSSQYTSYAIQGTTGKVNIAWNSTQQAYAITNNTTTGRALLQFGNTLLQNNVRISADIKLGGSNYKQNGMLAFIDKDSQSTYSVAGWVQGEKYYRLVEFNGTSELQTTSNTKWSSLSTSDYNHHELVYQNGVVTYTITTPSSQTKTVSLTLQKSNYVGGKLGLFIEVFSSATHCYIKNIKVEPL